MDKHNITGETFGYLTVIERSGVDKAKRNSTWLCKCKCGNYSIVQRSALVSGHTSSCGCKNAESKNVTHGMSKTRLYSEWLSMRKRCNNATKKDFKCYQGKGITVCDEWDKNFIAFKDWALSHGYTDELTIDRIDNDCGYSPDNCRWVTITEQQTNKSNTINVLFNGEYKCLRRICIENGFSYKLAHQRYRTKLKKGEEIITEELFAPPRHKTAIEKQV